MPKIRFDGREVECQRGANLRRVLLDHELPLYNGIARSIHCRGLGTCGTCAVRITGEVSPPTAVERWRLGFPPHDRSAGLRLACQSRVLGDLYLEKWDGLWGHQKPSVGEASPVRHDRSDPATTSSEDLPPPK